MRLKVSQKEASDFLRQNPNQKFLSAIEGHWNAHADDPAIDSASVDGTSVCWLFYWATAENANNEAAAEHARRAFNELVDIPFERFNKKVGRDFAGKHRSPRKDQRWVCSELNRLLGIPSEA